MTGIDKQGVSTIRKIKRILRRKGMINTTKGSGPKGNVHIVFRIAHITGGSHETKILKQGRLHGFIR
jgi:hypothetical protein